MKHVKFNANHNIKVRLKNKGIEHIVNQYNKLMPFEHHTSFKEIQKQGDEYGYHSFQLWDFLDTFGNLGMRSCDYFDIDIVFEFKYFEAFEFKDKISIEAGS